MLGVDVGGVSLATESLYAEGASSVCSVGAGVCGCGFSSLNKVYYSGTCICILRMCIDSVQAVYPIHTVDRGQ